jgi:ABC-type transport system involved in multi-copper enzyme maturation permease subunit
MLAALVVLSSLVVVIRFGDYQFVKDRPVSDELVFFADKLPPEDIIVDCEEFLAGARPELPPGFTMEDVDVGLTENECRLELVGFAGRLEKLKDDFTLPGAFTKGLRWTELLAVPVIAFFTVLVVGSEYGWGTWRTILMRGVGRWRALAVKLGLVAAIMVAVWIAISLTIIGTSAIVTALASGVGHGEWTASVTGEVIRDVGRAWYSGLPYIALGALLSVLFSSFAGGTLAAVAVATGYFFIELFSVGRLIQLFDGVSGMRWFASLIEYDLGWNTAGWMFGRNGEPLPGFALAGAIGTSDYPSDIHAFLVQAAFTVVLGAAAFWLFRRKDVAGPSG